MKVIESRSRSQEQVATACSRIDHVCMCVCVGVGVRACVFTALHGMQTRSSDENPVCPSVCLSVCLSNACIVTKRNKDLSIFLNHTKDHLA